MSIFSTEDLNALAAAPSPLPLPLAPSPAAPPLSSRKAAPAPAKVRGARNERRPVLSRRLRRVANDSALHVAAAETGALPTSRAELRSLFERSTRTSWTELSASAVARAAWAPFVDIDLDHLTTANTLPATSHTRNRHGDGGGLPRVDRRIRHVLKARAGAVRPLVRQVEDSVVDLRRGESVVLRLQDPLARLVAHGVAQFHGLAHRSSGIGLDRVLVVCGQGYHAQGVARLVDVLR